MVSHKHTFVLFYIKGPCPVLNVSYKPQKISPKSQGTVRQLLHDRIREAYIHPQFVSDVMKPLMIENIIDQEVIYQNAEQSHVVKAYHLSQCMRFPTMWYFDMYRLRRASAASFSAYKLQIVFSQ